MDKRWALTLVLVVMGVLIAVTQAPESAEYEVREADYGDYIATHSEELNFYFPPDPLERGELASENQALISEYFETLGEEDLVIPEILERHHGLYWEAMEHYDRAMDAYQESAEAWQAGDEAASEEAEERAMELMEEGDQLWEEAREEFERLEEEGVLEHRLEYPGTPRT